MKLSIVMPVYNEKNTLLKIIERIKNAALPKKITEKELIIIDDYSKDGTRELYKKINEKWIKVYYHEKNCGKGKALQTGFEKAGGDIILIQDADLEYDPDEYSKLLKPILEDNADVVYGSRFSGGESHRILYYWHYLANRFLTLLSNMYSDLNLSDMETCYKVFKKEILRKIRIEENRFGFEPEITAKIGELAREENIRIYEVGISYHGRTYNEGKKIGMKDALRAFWCIFKYNTSKFANFVKYSLIGILVALSQFAVITILVEIFSNRIMDFSGIDMIILENIANVISIEVSIICGFFLHSNITWRYKFKKSGDFIMKFFLFHLITFFSAAVRMGLFYGLSLIRFQYQLNALLGILAAVIINFMGYDKLFRSKSKQHINFIHGEYKGVEKKKF